MTTSMLGTFACAIAISSLGVKGLVKGAAWVLEKFLMGASSSM
jgi:hypothetical protein